MKKSLKIIKKVFLIWIIYTAIGVIILPLYHKPSMQETEMIERNYNTGPQERVRSIDTIGAFQVGVHMEGYAVGMTMAFLVLSISQLLHALNQRSNTESIFSTGNGHNPHLLLSIVMSALVLMIIICGSE